MESDQSAIRVILICVRFISTSRITISALGLCVNAKLACVKSAAF